MCRKLTIITVCYNAEGSIERTLKSLLGQTYSGYDYLIVDGKSEDRTLDIVNNYLDSFRIKGIEVTVISEPDRGLYDAMNKGIHRASGDWVEFLNSGTEYCSNDVLQKVSAYFESNVYDVIHGDFIRVPVDGRKKRYEDTSKRELFRKTMPLSHESSFFRKKMHIHYLYDLKYSIIADYNSCLKMFLDDIKFYHLTFPIVYFYEDGFSCKNRLSAGKQAWTIRIDNGVLKDTRWNQFLIRSGLCMWKEVIYYYICPKFIVNIWEEYKKSKK